MDVMVPRAVPPFAVDEPSQVGEARRRIVELGASIGLDSDQQGRLALVVNELGSNLVKHGGGGVLLIRGLQTPAAVEVLAIDRGAGMASVAECFRDGYSTAGSSGTGLGAVRRLASLVDVYTTQPGGTAIVARVAADSRRHRGGPALDVGAVTPFLWAFRDRERILDLFEWLSGARLLYNYIWIGGLSRDMPSGWLKKADAFLDELESRTGAVARIAGAGDIRIVELALEPAGRRRRAVARRLDTNPERPASRGTALAVLVSHSGDRRRTGQSGCAKRRPRPSARPTRPRASRDRRRASAHTATAGASPQG